MTDPHAHREMPEAADPNWHHPVEDMEPLDTGSDYREASMRLIRTLNRAMIFIADADDKRLAVWQVAYAMGLPICEGISMTDRAERLTIKRATLSKGAKAFLRAANLPPSEYMKSAESTASYSQARLQQLPN